MAVILHSWKVLMVIVVLVVHLKNVHSSKELIKKISVSFLKFVDDCKKELSLSEDLAETLFKFWNEDEDLGNRELGCMILCMAEKQNLIELEKYKMHHENSFDYAMRHGADEETAKQLVTIVRECEMKSNNTEDYCLKIIEATKCFRTEIHSLKWAPSLEVMVGEILTDL